MPQSAAFVSSNYTRTELAAEVDRQLQQGGLFGHLLQIFTDLCAQLASAQPSHTSLFGLKHVSSLERNSPQADLYQLWYTTHDALLLYISVLTLWPGADTPAAWDPAIDIAAVSLALTAAQHVSKWIDKLPAESPQAPVYMLAAILDGAAKAVMQCVLRRAHDPDFSQPCSSGRRPRFAPLLQCEQLLPALCFATFYNLQSSSAKAEATAATRSSTASSSSSTGKG
jgi:hypothetical protein